MPEATVLSYGMGVESTILLRWILEPDTRPCDLADLIVITAQVGDEYAETGADVDTHILPLMREHGIRWVQVARHGHLEADGITILEDSQQPTRAYLEGDYKLSDELRRNGTVPQFSGVHRCALKFKAFVIEQWLSQNVRRSVKHALGYNADETSRIANSEYSFERRAGARVAFGFNVEETGRIERASEYDGLRGSRATSPAVSSEKIAFGFNTEETGRIERNAEYNTLSRTAFYPLLEWGWTRQRCIEYIRAALGLTWKKSCCVYCPYVECDDQYGSSSLPPGRVMLLHVYALESEEPFAQSGESSRLPKRGSADQTPSNHSGCPTPQMRRPKVIGLKWFLMSPRTEKKIKPSPHAKKSTARM